ncbi:rhythmically expressed gene 5 protein-like [Daphnia carinata]|uniref:rhythmically expressed gene 5 protein-like n=1 Tax=Daphnia carinata TaxID=120202 RepID=UPI00257F1586|nr:rhythmically expressed gene 5 protein-like [Daphnia carinata]XP_057373572.1 rhythmically expressed gene 5 protein-like [Daphnia carinata]
MSRWCCCSLFVIVSLLLVSQPQQTDGAAIPIWELLKHEEKMGRLFYVFVHLVEQYCKTSDIPDCPKVLTLYGMSNLVSESEHSLDLMDPYQRDAKTIVWEKIMRGEFKLPTKLTSGKPMKTPLKSSVAINNEVYSSPYEIRVRPPATFIAPPVASSSPSDNKQQPEQNKPSSSLDLSGNSDEDDTSSKLTIIRFGRSLASPSNNDNSPVPLLSEEDAETLNQLFA